MSVAFLFFDFDIPMISLCLYGQLVINIKNWRRRFHSKKFEWDRHRNLPPDHDRDQRNEDAYDIGGGTKVTVSGLGDGK